MRAPTSADTLRILIEDFRRFLPAIEEARPSEDFEREFHARLDLIENLSTEMPDSRAGLMHELFEACDVLDRSDCHYRGRRKPLGYAGDFKMIDFIYCRHLSKDPVGRLWDEFFHRQLAPRSVVNRKTYFVDLVHALSAGERRPWSILDIASGPCRDLAEAFEGLNGASEGAIVHCVDSDAASIDFASALLEPFQAHAEIAFARQNALKLRPTQRYDLVWSAGLFDYLEDRVATILLRKMWSWAQPGGSLVVGNFHEGQAGRTYMEWCGEWFLIHRSADRLRTLAEKAGIPSEAVEIDYEPLEVCVFLKATKPR